MHSTYLILVFVSVFVLTLFVHIFFDDFVRLAIISIKIIKDSYMLYIVNISLLFKLLF